MSIGDVLRKLFNQWNLDGKITVVKSIIENNLSFVLLKNILYSLTQKNFNCFIFTGKIIDVLINVAIV